MGETREWMNAEQAADYVGLDVEVLRRKARAGDVRHTRTHDSKFGLLKFKREWLDDFMEKRAVGGN